MSPLRCGYFPSPSKMDLLAEREGKPKRREARGLTLCVGGVVLAAGLSVRMGRPKLLLRLGSKSIIRRVAENALASRLAEIVVVVGREGARIREELVGLEVKIVENREVERGQSGSLKLGLGALAPGTAAAMFLLGDQPLVGSQVIDALVAAFEATGKAIVVPLYNGRRGNPVLFARSLFPELLAVEGDQGGREVARRHAKDTALVPMDSARAALDVDTLEDYERLVALVEREGDGIHS